MPSVGIDLGTTSLCVGAWQNGRVTVIANEQGNHATPAYIAFTDEERLIGETAKSQMTKNASNTVYDIKRLIGRKFSDPTVQTDIKTWPFTVIEQDGDKIAVEVDYLGERQTFTPEQLTAMLLEQMKLTAEQFLGEPVERVVLTVPANFTDAQRQATLDAGAIAGLKIQRIINEPSAAAMAYGLDKPHSGQKTALIYDLGGGSLDVSLLSIDDGLIEVLATSGDTHLGGEDFDGRLVTHFAKEFRKKTRGQLDMSKNKRALRRLRTSAERAKRTLSSSPSASVEIDALYEGVDLYCSINRAVFESLCMDLFRGTIQHVKNVLRTGGVDKAEVDEVILVGGSSRIPYIQKKLSDFFDGKALNKSIGPDDAPAHGATIQSALLDGVSDDRLKEISLCDATPLSLGLETSGGVMTVLIPRHSRLPATRTETFSTFEENQESVLVQVYEGERTQAKDNANLGKFVLSGITAAPAGQPEIEVTFTVSAEGILTVSAVDKANGTPKSIEIKSEKGNLSPEALQKLVQEAAEARATEKEEAERVAQAAADAELAALDE